MTFILPQIEREYALQCIQQKANWYDPINQTVVNTQINTYLCPAAVGTHRQRHDRRLVLQPPRGAKPISAATTDYTGIWGIDPSLYSANGI